MPGRKQAAIEVRSSGIHGLGVFATADMPSETPIGRYTGRRSSAEDVAARDWDASLTYLFGLSDGSVIDGARGGNATRHLNHSCAPNCQAFEVQGPGGRLTVQIETLLPVSRGDELSIDYALNMDAGRPEDFPCRCGAPACRGTMLAVPAPMPISRFPVPDIHDLPEDIRTRILAVQEKSGFVPNVFLTLAHRPDEFRAFFAYHDALMDKPVDKPVDKPSKISKAEREMIVVATSNANQCQYCVVAHGAILRIRAKNPLVADQVAVNYRKADITPRQKAMLDFAMKVSTQSHAVGDDDFMALQAHGFDMEDAWDIAGIAAFFGLSNRMANVTSMRPNDEFFAMGR